MAEKPSQGGHSNGGVVPARAAAAQPAPAARRASRWGTRLVPGGYLLVLALLLVAEIVGVILARGWVSSRHRAAVHRTFETQGVGLARNVQSELEDYSRELEHLRLRYRSRGGPPTMERAVEDARLRLEALEWAGIVAGNGRGYWRVPATEQPLDEKTLSGSSAAWASAFATARDTGREASTGWLREGTWAGDIGVIVPLSVEFDHSAAGDPLLVAVMDGTKLFAGALGQKGMATFNVEIRDGETAVARFGSAGTGSELEPERHPIAFHGHDFELWVWPTEAYVDAHVPGTAPWVLWIGILTALLTTVLIHQLLLYRLHSRHDEQQYSEALESLNELTTAIASRLGAGQEALQQLADAARDLMGMSFSSVATLQEQPGEEAMMRILAFGGHVPPDAPRTWRLADAPISRRCVETGDVVMIGDARNAPGMNQAALKQFGLTAMVAIPLRVGQRRTGVITLGDHKVRDFTDADGRLARLLGSQAAVILSNNNLYEQTLKKAEDNAILLRELHHRVKNNLAGILGLLSSAPAGADEASRQWLARVIDRIRTMAAAHELFTTGIGTIGLGRLVEQVVPTLSVIQPGGVTVRTVVEGEEPRFATAEAVTLAMVLHELCVNAIQHGTGSTGVVTIRARRSDDHTTIEVVDSGRSHVPSRSRQEVFAGAAPDSDRASSATSTAIEALPRGLGLRLVRELVSRELRGTFRLQIAESGGAVATVRIPADNGGSRS